MKPIKFACPFCGKEAYYYGRTSAACVYHGWLLYTDIPKDVKAKDKSKKGWTTIDDIVKKTVRHE